MSKLICPYCFEKLDESKIEYRCYNIKTTHTNKGEDKQDHFAFKKEDVGYSNGMYICPDCGVGVVRYCPDCSNRLPDIGSKKLLPIAMCGVRGSGKTHYVASVIGKIYSTCSDHNISVRPNSENDLKNYNELKKDFEHSEDHVIESTQLKDVPSIIFRYESKKKGFLGSVKKVDFVISFVDAAGEIFENENKLMANGAYIANSSMIILVLDPTNMKGVRDTLKRENIRFAGDNVDVDFNNSNENVLSRIINICKNRLKLSDSQIINIPIMIGFSKWDYIQQSSLIKKEFFSLEGNSVISNGKSLFSETAFNNNSRIIEAFINQFEGEKNFINMLNDNFQDVHYFAFSAYGSETYINEQGYEEAPPISFKTAKHVEDPFFWLLNKKIF